MNHDFIRAMEIARKERPDFAAWLQEPGAMEIMEEAAALLENMPKERLKVLREKIREIKAER